MDNCMMSDDVAKRLDSKYEHDPPF